MLVGNGADATQGLELAGRVGIAWDKIDMFVAMKDLHFHQLQQERAKAKDGLKTPSEH